MCFYSAQRILPYVSYLCCREQSVGVISTAESRFFEPDDFKSMTFKYLALLYRICGTDSLLNKLRGEFLNLCYIAIKQFLNNKKRFRTN